ncbi:MAG: metal ABC transporter permease [Bradyrhizobium sp.]
MSSRILVLSIAASALALSAASAAAGTSEHVRGVIALATADSVTVDPYAGKPLTVALTGKTAYLKVEKSSLDKVEKSAFIGTATKDVGGTQVALEVVVFPPAMRGTGEGHYAWDKIPDTTLSGSARTTSSMTDGNVAAVSTPAPTVKSSMTNGNVAASKSQGGTLHLVVTYKGGKQDVLVPPTAPIVTLQPGTKVLVAKGSHVFISATKTDSGLIANAVAVGVGGVKPPM